MKVTESIRYNRTGEINDAVVFDHEDADRTAVMALMVNLIADQGVETRRNLFTTVAIRIEF